MVEHYLDTVGVSGSKPLGPTGGYEDPLPAVHRAGHNLDRDLEGAKTTSAGETDEREQLLLELEEALSDALTALNVCGAPARDSYQRVWKHAREKAQRMLAKVATRSGR